jgi:hypothetical protein
MRCQAGDAFLGEPPFFVRPPHLEEYRERRGSEQSGGDRAGTNHYKQRCTAPSGTDDGIKMPSSRNSVLSEAVTRNGI